MAEGDGTVLNNTKEQLLKGAFDLSSDTLRVFMWHTTSPDIDTHTAYSDFSGNEVSDGGSNYTAKGEAVSTPAVSQDNTNDRGKLDDDGSDITWSSLLLTTPADATPDYAGLMDDTHASDLVLWYWELGTTATNGGDYTLQFSSDGIGYLG